MGKFDVTDKKKKAHLSALSNQEDIFAKMSFEVEEDTELRDLVTSALQTSGVLGKIKAQLRSNVYLAIEGEDELKKKSNHVNTKLDRFASTSEGRLALQLIREFLVFFGLDYSQMVFEPEAVEGRGVTLRDREELIENLGFAETLNQDVPLLSEIIKLSKVSVLKSETPTPTSEAKKFLFRNEEDLSLASDKSSVTSSSAKSPEHSFSNVNNKSSLNVSKKSELKDFDSTYTLNCSNNNDKSRLDESAAQKSLLGDLPPLGGGGPQLGKNPSLSLAPLKKVPPVAKVEATKKEDPKPKPAVEVKPMASVKPSEPTPSAAAPPAPEPQSLSITEDIDEEMDEFLNSSISASDDFTKEESVSEGASLRADYEEKL